MTDTNIFALAQVIKAAGTDPGDVTDAVWAAGHRKPARTTSQAVALALDIVAGFEGNDLPWSVWPKDYDGILQSELNEVIEQEMSRENASPASAAKAIIAAGYLKGDAGEPLIITLPDTSSKAFWSGTGKCEVFHPETYRRWAKEAIERDCAIGGIVVEVR